MKCIYCLQDKDPSEFSLEHIIPQSCGGINLPKHIFTTDRVCQRCNNLCGLFVDSGFLKSHLVTNAKSALQEEWYRKGLSTIPLPHYMGKMKALSTHKQVCDFWLLSYGSRVYHYYPDEEKFRTQAGGNPINKRKGRAKAFLVFSENVGENEERAHLNLASFINFFSPADLYGVNIECHDRNGETLIRRAYESQEEYDNLMNSMDNIECSTVSTLDINISNRFYSKIALCIGYNIYGESFLEFSYTRELSNSLWYRPWKPTPKTLGSDFILGQDRDLVMELTMNWQYGNAVTISPYGKGLLLALSFFGKLATVIALTVGYKALSPRIHIPHEGLSFLWTMDGKHIFGPYSFAKYVVHRLGNKPIPELEAFEKKFS